MSLRGIQQVKFGAMIVMAGLLLFSAAFLVNRHYFGTSQSNDGITIVPTLTSSKYPILLPNATKKATIDTKAAAASPEAQTFPRQI